MIKNILFKYVIILSIVCVITILCISLETLKNLKDWLSEPFMPAMRFSQPIIFSDPYKHLFINTATWGLTGNHEYIFFSDSEKRHPNENSDLIFSQRYLFYKVDKDELIIWTEGGNARLGPKNITFNGIKTQINSFPSYEKYREFEAMHKELGFFKASIFSEVVPPYPYDGVNIKENAGVTATNFEEMR